MNRLLYYLLCAITCTYMVSATMPMAAIAEALQPQATPAQQAQTDTTTNTDETATPATPTPQPSLRTQANGTSEAISAAAETGYAHSATASQNGVTFTVSWNDAPAGAATTFHATQTNGSSQAKARMDVPTY